MLIERILFGGWRRFRKYTFIPCSVFLAMIVFLLREFFLGFENANNYLRRVSQSSIVPILRMKGAKIGAKCNIQSGITIHNCRDYKRLSVGTNCHIGKNSFLDLRDTITIGDNVVIAMNNTLITHTDMNNSDLREKYPPAQAPIEIKHDTYLGTNCTVLMGITIEEKSIIGANSLVKSNVDQKTIYAGAPAVKIRSIDGV